MKTRNYKIADIAFKVIDTGEFHDNKENPFIRDSIDDPYVTIKSEFDPSLKEHIPFPENHNGIIGLKTKSGYEMYLHDVQNIIAHKIITDQYWSNITTLSSMPQRLPFEGSVGEIIFRNTILFNQGIVIHASAISYEGQGIIFSAPSGTGKSTQANLWRKHRDAKVLNGDRPALRLIGDTVHVYGTPWSGSSPDFLNSSSILSAIVIIEQDETNSIRQLSPAEAVQLILPRCFMPYFDEYLMDLAIKNTDMIINKVPIFLFKCRPDVEAVEMVEKCLKY